MKVLLTGATGFIGSHMAETLVDDGCELMIVKRSSSALVNLSSFIDKIQYVDMDCDSWISQSCSFSPDIIIHSAWNGITANSRDDLQSQLSNIDFVNKLLFIADKCHSAKFIGLGSQAEYGELSKKISENTPLEPITYYGLFKACACRQIESYCAIRGINWYWLRIFSVYGERESRDWLLPSVIEKAFSGGQMDFTRGEQKYAYLYVKDLANAILKVCKKEKGKSGIYNISSSKAIQINELLTFLLDMMHSKMRLNFGAIPYRKNQSMHIEGDSSNFIKEFGAFEKTSLSDGLKRMVNYYRNNEII